jgi:hypothetical protein
VIREDDLGSVAKPDGSPAPSFTFDSETLRLVTGTYGNGGLAVRILTEDGEPFATLSVRMPDDDLPPGVFRLKTWSENAAIAAAVIAAGLITRVDLPRASSGYVGADAYRLAVEP